jgi:hypothetical protein
MERPQHARAGVISNAGKASLREPLRKRRRGGVDLL